MDFLSADSTDASLRKGCDLHLHPEPVGWSRSVDSLASTCAPSSSPASPAETCTRARSSSPWADSSQPRCVPRAVTCPNLVPRRAPLCAPGATDPCCTNVAFFQRSVSVDPAPWVAGDFASARTLNSSIFGEVKLLSPAAGGAGVVAKVVSREAVAKTRSRESNEKTAFFGTKERPIVEDLASEAAVLALLQRSSAAECPCIIRFLGLFEDASSVYLLTEHCQGGDLFDRVSAAGPILEEEKQRYVLQMLQAVRHMHGHNIGHRDISLENFVLRKSERGGHDCVLLDFAQAVRLRALDGTTYRYFSKAGKPMYRAPEMYVPREQVLPIICPDDGGPGSVAQVGYGHCRCEVLLPSDALPGLPCEAEPHGYAAAPADIFACGVCVFALSLGKPPWATARDSDPTFSFVRRRGMATLLLQRRRRAKPKGNPAAEDPWDPLIAQMLRVDPICRGDAVECLRDPWLSA